VVKLSNLTSLFTLFNGFKGGEIKQKLLKFNDLSEKLSYIRKWHSAAVFNEKKKQFESGGSYIPTQPDLEKAINACKRKHEAYYGKSKYIPHQGAQERAGRLK